ncbi:MAG: DUF1385 domain-containing protein [Candidatus Margulisiibacteriota bacterium]
MPENQLAIGGQAVIEGVLMRSQTAWAVAVRTPDHKIIIQKKDEIPWTKRYKILGLPIVRGAATLVETMLLGIKAINYSTNQSLPDPKEKLSKNELIFSLLVSFAVAILLFIVTPAFIFASLKGLGINTILLNLIEGTIRLSIFLIFLLAISFMPDMRRVFEYHGAEHLAVHLYDKVKDKNQLTIAACRQFNTQHPSCGTSFIMVVLVVSVIVFSFLGRPDLLARVGLKLLLLPLVAGIAYEIIRVARRPNAPFFFKILVAPGMWLQLITTRNPSDDQIEVALAALKEVI